LDNVAPSRLEDRMLRQRLNDALKEAMKAKNARATSTCRLILAALKDRDIASRTADDREGIGDEDILKLLQSMIKQRRDSIEAYTKGNRPDLAKQEQEEIEIIQSFLPQQMTDAEIETAVDAALKDAQASSLKQMGAVMALLRERFAGRMDMAKAGARVKARLG
jgi:hypothetical protein